MARQASKPGGKQKAEQGERKPWGRMILGLLIGLCGVGGAVLLANEVRQQVLDDPQFTMAGEYADIENTADFMIYGLNHTPRARVVEVFADDFGKNIFLIPIEQRRIHLQGIDWVKEATVSRIWPNKIIVRIQERTPVAFARIGSGDSSRLALIDDDGVLLEQSKGKALFSFPILTGLDGSKREADLAQQVARMQRLMNDVGTLSSKVSQVNVAKRELVVTLDLDGRSIDLLIGTGNFRNRLQQFINHYPEIGRTSPQTVLFDLQIDDTIIARGTKRHGQ